MAFNFLARERLKSKTQISALFDRGKYLTNHPVRMIYIKTQDQSAQFKVAFSVPKRSFKKAVHRNRIKRLLRECYRLNKDEYFNNMEGNFAFLILYLGREMPNFSSLEAAMNTLFLEFKRKEG